MSSLSLPRSWILLLLAFSAGLAAVMAVKGNAAPAPQSSVLGQDQAEVVSALLAANEGLRGEMEQLDERIREAGSGEGASRLEEMADSLNALRVVNGDAAAVGPGIELRVTGDLTAVILRDLINELKSAGAEALAVNGGRLRLWTAVYSVEGGIMVEGQLVSDSATIEAIGDPLMLEEALSRPGGLVALLTPQGVSVSTRQRTGGDEVRLAVYPDRRKFQYASAP